MRRPSGFDSRGEEAHPPESNDPEKSTVADENERQASRWFHPRKRVRHSDEEIATLQDEALERELKDSVWDKDREPVSREKSPSGRFPSIKSTVGKWLGNDSEQEFDPEHAVSESDRRVRQAKAQLKYAEREAKKAEKRQRRRFLGFRRKQLTKWWIAIGAVVLLAAFVGLGVFTPVMDVRDIEIVGAEHVDEQELAEALQPIEGTPIALVDDDDVYRALESFVLVQSFSVETVPPHRLIVRIQERVPVLAIEEGAHFRQYDVAGVMISESEEPPENLPIAEGDVRNPGSEAFQAAAGVLRAVPAKLRAEVASVDASTLNDVTLTLHDGIEVRWGGTEDSQVKAVILDRMRKALADSGVSMIDVSSSSAPVYE